VFPPNDASKAMFRRADVFIDETLAFANIARHDGRALKGETLNVAGRVAV
jgi:hypothetical protein